LTAPISVIESVPVDHHERRREQRLVQRVQAELLLAVGQPARSGGGGIAGDHAVRR